MWVFLQMLIHKIWWLVLSEIKRVGSELSKKPLKKLDHHSWPPILLFGWSHGSDSGMVWYHSVKINNVVFDLILYISISTFPMCSRNTALQPATCWRRSSQSKVKDDNGCKPQSLGSKAKSWKDCLALLFWRSLCAAMWDGRKKIQIFQRCEIDAKKNTVAQGTN